MCGCVCHFCESIKLQHQSKSIRLRNLFLCVPVSLSLPFPFWQFGCSEDLGGCIVCHLASETDTKSFGCDLFELMVQNIVSTPTPRGNFVGALGQYKWLVVHLCGQHTHAKPTHISVHINLLTYVPTRKALKFTPLPYPPLICPAEAILSTYSYI